MVLGKVICNQIKVIDWLRSCDCNLDNHFDIWRIYIPNYLSSLDSFSQVLSLFEKRKMNSFKDIEDKNRYLIAHYFVRKIGADYLKIDPSKLQISYTSKNKPYFKYYQSLNFNISHSGDYVIIGFANKWSVGVDIELINTELDLYDLIYNCMSTSEISMILNSNSPRSIFFKHWTRKEALLKGVGIGLTDRIKDMSCLDGLNLMPYDLSSFASSWKIKSFEMDEYSVSVAHDSALRIVRFYQL